MLLFIFVSVMTPQDLDELHMLMEKLQSRSSQSRNWAETIKALRVAITNVRFSFLLFFWNYKKKLSSITILDCLIYK